MTFDEVLNAVRQLTATEKLELIRILGLHLDVAEDVLPNKPFKTYDLPIPYNNFGVGAVLMEAFKQSDTGQA